MKKLIILSTLFFFLSSCSGWEYTIPSPLPLIPTSTPIIYSPTPRFITPTGTSTTAITPPTTLTASESPSPSESPISEVTETVTASETSNPPLPGIVTVNVIGCNTSIDISHGMGEVTNAYVTVSNTTGVDLIDLCATLNAYDEGRVHPDKTVCVPLLKNNYQVMLKLTADSTYKEETPIQIEVIVAGKLQSRVGEASCTDIGLFTPKPAILLTPVAIQ